MDSANTANTGMYFSASLDCWVVEGYAEAVAVMREPALEIPRLPLPTQLLSVDQRARLAPLLDQAERLPLYSTGRAHQRLRRELRAPFTRDAVGRWRRSPREDAHGLIEAWSATGRLEVITDVAHPVLRRTLADVVGIPVRMRADFDGWADASMDVGKLATPEWSDRTLAEAVMASDSIERMVRELMADPEHVPQGSVLAHAVARRGETTALSVQEVAANVRSLYTAGTQTTIFLVASAAHLLFVDEAILEEVRRDRGVVADVVRETLRYACPAVETNIRRATRDVTVGTHTIRRGQFLRTVVLRANRDPRHFHDPDVFDHHRSRQGTTLAFGAGAHVCLGNHLATAVAEETCAALADPRYHARLVAPLPKYRRRAAVPVMWGPDPMPLSLS